MESLNPELALYHSKYECTITNTGTPQISEVSTGAVSLHRFSHSSLVDISSEHLNYQTVRELKVHLPHMSCVMCHMPCVICHVSHVICQQKNLKKKIDKMVELVDGGSVINKATLSSLQGDKPCY